MSLHMRGVAYTRNSSPMNAIVRSRSTITDAVWVVPTASDCFTAVLRLLVSGRVCRRIRAQTARRRIAIDPAELGLEDLAHRALRQLGEKRHLPRNLEAADAPAAVLDDVFGARRLSRSQHDGSEQRLAVALVGNTDHRAFANRRMLVQRRLDF